MCVENYEMKAEANNRVIFLPTYSIWLIGVIMIIMLLAIVLLSLALYLNIKKIRRFGINTKSDNFELKEESIVETQYNHNDEYNKDDVSTLTVNSGCIREVNRLPEPVPKTRSDDTKIILTKKPFRPMSPIIQRRQMDAICKEVLKRVKKSDSASFRDLNALLNYSKNEEKDEPKNEISIELDLMNSTSKDLANAIIKELESNNEKRRKQADTKESLIDTTEQQDVNKIYNEVNTNAGNAIKIKVQNVSGDDDFEESGQETEYDTLPSPVRCRSSANLGNYFNDDSIPVYDLPPRRSYDGKTLNVIQLDNHTQYSLPISSNRTDSCYINARRPAKSNYKRSTSEENPRTNSNINL